MALPADPWAPVTPAKLVAPSWSFTRGPEVADLCALLGYEPMPEQEQWLDAVFAVGSDGLPAVTDATDIAGRQNLKTGEFVMTAIGWLFLTEEERLGLAGRLRQLVGQSSESPALDARLN